MPAANVTRAIRFIAIALGIFIVSAGLTLGGIAYAYRDTYYPGVRVGGVSLAGKSQEEGERLIREKVRQYMEHRVVVTVPKITEPRNESTGQYPELEIATTSKELGISFNQEEALQEAWQTGHERNLLLWFTKSIRSIFSNGQQPIVYTVNADQVNTFINTKIVPQVTNPTPANIVINKTVVEIADSKPGLKVDEAALAKQLSDAMASSTDSDVTYLRAPADVVDSPITRKAIQPIADRLDQLGNVSVTLAVEDITLRPKRADLLTWFDPIQDENGAVSLALDQNAVSTYIQKNGQNRLNLKNSLNAAVKSLSALVSPEATTTQLAKPVSVTLVAKPKLEPNTGNCVAGRFPGKYVDVSLKDQTLCLFNGETLEKSFWVSTGKWSMPTPTGEFEILNKIARAWSATYKLYIPWWQGFIGTVYGFHELPETASGWKEGANHLGIPVSHGCIRLGVGPAKEVYDWTEIGTKVVIH